MPSQAALRDGLVPSDFTILIILSYILNSTNRYLLKFGEMLKCLIITLRTNFTKALLQGKKSDMGSPTILDVVQLAWCQIFRENDNLSCLRFMPELLQCVDNVFLKCGSITKVTLFNETYVILREADHIKALLSSSNEGHLDKSPLFYEKTIGELLGNGLIIASVNRWKPHRKFLGKVFTYTAMKFYTSNIFSPCSKNLLSQLESTLNKKIPGSEVQLNTPINYYTLIAISQAVLGLEAKFESDLSKFYQNTLKTKTISMKRRKMPWLHFNALWRIHPMSKTYSKSISEINDVIRKMIMSQNERTALKKDDDDKEIFQSMLQIMMDAGVSGEELFQEIKTMILAGFESTATTMQFLLFLLALHQDHQELCRKEIDSIFEDSTLVDKNNLTYVAVSEMKHLEKCLMETLRMFPTAYSYTRKLSSVLRLDETTELPAGTNVAVWAYGLHKDPRHYPHPTKFDPERFSQENCKARHPYAFVPFSAGARNCIGYKFSILEIKTMTAYILRSFEVFTTDDINSVPLLPSIVLNPVRDYNFILRKRNIENMNQADDNYEK